YLRYCCDYDGRNTPAMLILRPGREPILLTGNPNTPHNRSDTVERGLWFEDVRYLQPQLMGDEIARILGEGSQAARRVAYMGYNETPAPVWKSLERMSSVEWVHDFATHIDKRRAQKNGLELAFHRRAAEI